MSEAWPAWLLNFTRLMIAYVLLLLGLSFLSFRLFVLTHADCCLLWLVCALRVTLVIVAGFPISVLTVELIETVIVSYSHLISALTSL